MKQIFAGIMSAGVLAAPAVAAAQESFDYVPVDQSLIETIDRQLPEAQAVGADFLNETYFPGLTLSADSQLSATFVNEGAGYRNSVGYFAYQDGAFDGMSFGDIDTDSSGRISTSEIGALSGVTDMGMMFDNFSAQGSGGSLVAGDTTVFGGGSIEATSMSEWTMSGGSVFEAGTNVGFFLSANAWNGRSVNGWDNYSDPNTYWTIDFLNPENSADATIDDVSRETRHVAMLNVIDANQVIVGFEDLNRATGDNDFNDAIFIVRSDPVDAIADSNVPQIYSAPAPALNVLSVAGLLGAAAVMRRRRTASKP